MKFLFGLLLFLALPAIADAQQWDRGACERLPSGGQPLCPSLQAGGEPPVDPATVVINTPVTGTRYITTSQTVLLTGNATCPSGTPSVSWVNNQGGSGSMTGTTSWSMTGTGAVLTPHRLNVITVSLSCGSGTVATDQLTVAYSAAREVIAYSLDENAGTAPQDTSGQANHGSFGAGVAYTSTAQKYGASALDFSGGTLTVPNSTTLSEIIGGFTIVAWINPDTVQSGARAISHGSSTIGGETLAVYTAFPGQSGCATGSVLGAFTDRDGNYHVTCGPTPIPTGNYTCAAITYDGTALTTWVNKIAVSSVAKNYEFPSPLNSSLTIGNRASPSAAWDGKIDEFRLANYAYNQSQIATACDTQIGSAPPAPATGLKVGSVSVRIGDKDIKLGF